MLITEAPHARTLTGQNNKSWETFFDMKTVTKILAAVVMSVGVFGATQSFAGAGDDCKGYALAAAKLQQQNEARSCKLTGDGWTTDIKKLVSWCESVPPQKWKASLIAQAETLKACK